jgi:hypothetical protein
MQTKSPLHQPLSNRALNNQIRRIMRDLDRLSEELEDLKGRIPVPANSDVEAMLSQERDITLDALLLGVLQRAAFYVSEASVVLDTYAPYTAAAPRRAEKGLWRLYLKAPLQTAMRFRGEKCVAPSAD